MPRLPSKHGVTTIAILTRAPIPGQTKTRLIPALGARGAADLHARLLQRTVRTAFAAGLGPVHLWCTPDCKHPIFTTCQKLGTLALHPQNTGDLGARMLATLAPNTPTLIIGTDCPALTPEHLQQAARAINQALSTVDRALARDVGLKPELPTKPAPVSSAFPSENDAVLIPAEDGGYVLIGLRQPTASIFADMTWGCASVLEQTRLRLRAAGLRWVEHPSLWDVDEPADLSRLSAFAPELLSPP